ncbi:MAG: hypothetical protein ABIJ48_11800 [Actinomycetota bacterium]
MWTKRRIAAGLTTLLLFFTMAGVAVASDWSAPGNALYGIDRAAERVGIGAGGLPERLDEALALAGAGRPAAALEHAADALATESEGTGAADALLAAAEAVLSNDEGDADEVRQAVAEMLLWMSTTELTGTDFGLAVAAQAQELSTGLGSPDDLPGPPDDLPAPPVSTPAGPPDELPEPPGGFPTLP